MPNANYISYLRDIRQQLEIEEGEFLQISINGEKIIIEKQTDDGVTNTSTEEHQNMTNGENLSINTTNAKAVVLSIGIQNVILVLPFLIQQL